MKTKYRVPIVAVGILVLLLIAFAAGFALFAPENKSPANPADYPIALKGGNYLKNNNVQYLDVLSEANADRKGELIPFTDAVQLAVAYFEDEQGKVLQSAQVYVNYRGSKDGKQLSYLLEIKQMSDSALTDVRINAKTGELISIEKVDEPFLESIAS